MEAASRPAPSLAVASAIAAASAGFLTEFTVSVGGEMPLGEVVFMGVVAWVVLWGLVTGSLPAELPRTHLFRVLLACQVVAFGAYVFSDLYRHSTPHDMARGWARMAFLAIDIVSVAYLVGCSRLCLFLLVFGQLLGETVHALLFGALFGDLWKFGVGVPLTYVAILAATFFGRPAAAAAALVMCGVNFVMDFRSYGGLCLLAGVCTLITLFPRRMRRWLILPGLVFVAAALTGYVVIHSRNAGRATRSDISRQSMMIAAFDGFRSSPFIGQGSWFGKSKVFDNYMTIQADAARDEHIGGLPTAKQDPLAVAIHSQILVALAEGGVFGAAFFVAFGVAMASALYRMTFVLPGNRFTCIYLLLVLSSLFNLFLSPFSGAHRVYIAITCGLVLFLDPVRARRPRPSPVLAVPAYAHFQ